MFCVFGAFNMNTMLYGCWPEHVEENTAMINIVSLGSCFVVSCVVTFYFVVQETMDKLMVEIADEYSVQYRMYSWLITYKIRRQQETNFEQH